MFKQRLFSNDLHLYNLPCRVINLKFPKQGVIDGWLSMP